MEKIVMEDQLFKLHTKINIFESNNYSNYLGPAPLTPTSEIFAEVIKLIYLFFGNLKNLTSLFIFLKPKIYILFFFCNFESVDCL
jgi:hypothetical protein